MSISEDDINSTNTPLDDSGDIDDSPKNGDEQIKNEPLDLTTSTTTTTGSTELSDPAILAVCDNRKYRYTRDELLKLRDTPLSQKKPDFLDINEVSPSIWDPNRWNSDNNRKKTDIPLENGSRTNDLLDHRRRPGERLRKDDGIVLCPQRRSFNSGCFVPVTRDLTRTNTTRPHSPLGSKSETSHLTGVRDIQTNNRRIGSGRILRDTWDFSDKTDTDNDYGFRNNTNQQQQQQRNNDDLNNRRTFGRDFDKDRRNNTNIINTNQQNRYNTERRRLNSNSRDHHHHNHNHHEEPEWFSGGPSSQNDTIELRGFDDNEKLTTTNNNNNGNKKKMSPSQAKRARDWYKKKHENSSNTIPEEKDNDGNNLEIKDDNIEDNTVDDKLKNDIDDDDDNNKKDDKNHIDDQCSIFEDILKADTIPGLPGILTNGVGGDSDGQSRFSKWFSKDNSSRNDSRRSSIQDDQQSLITQQFLSNILTDDATNTISTSTITTTTTTTTTKGINVKINDDSNSYFAPISPAINHNHNNFLQQLPTQQTNKSINIMEMLQKTKQFDNNLIKPMHMPPGRIVNLADLEAKIRQNSEQLHKSHHHQQQQQQQQKSDDDMSAFNQLLAQVSGGHIIPANGSLLGLQKPPQQQQQPPMSLMEMLNHSQQQDEARMAQMMCGPISPNLHPHLQQQQQQHNDLQRYHHLNKLNLMRSSPLMMDLGLQQSRELLNRPEAQAILQGLKVGDITLQHLHQQLANPALQPRHRELLYTILKQQQQQNGVGNTNSNNNNSGGGNTTNLGASPRVLSPVPPQQSYQQQQQQQQQTTTPPSQQLRLSPLPPNAMHQRIPSPRELQVHTQNILQRALIKKKLEEQQENYRKRQEMQQQQSTISTNTTAPTTITTLSSSSSSSSSSTTTTTSTTTKSVSSPTPLAFTPTSVLRKMTAEKDDKDFNKLVGGDSGKLAQGRAVTGIKQQSQQQQWGGFGLNLKQAGRPIVKANNYQPTQEQFYQQQQQQIFNQLAQEQQQQQQQRKMMGQFPYNLMTTTTNSTTIQQHHPQYQNQFSQLTQQQLRAQHQQHARPTTTTTSTTTTQSTQQFGGNWQQSNPTINQRSNQLIRNNDGGNDLTTPSTTTTTNQLTRWFSPDLLERARIGELPSTEELPQHCLSVEDIERISATTPQQPPPPVHN